MDVEGKTKACEVCCSKKYFHAYKKIFLLLHESYVMMENVAVFTVHVGAYTCTIDLRVSSIYACTWVPMCNYYIT